MNKKKQVSAPMTQFMGAEAFRPNEETAIYWLGSGGIFINCHGTLLMIDPVIEMDANDAARSEAGFPFLVPPPIVTSQVERLDAILYTHADYDHMAPQSAKGLQSTGGTYYGTEKSCSTLQGFGIPKEQCCTLEIGQEFRIGPITITLTPCSHAWQKGRPGFDWYYGPKDCCGFYMKTPDGVLWIPGDSILMEEHLKLSGIDCMFFDVSDDPFHFGHESAVRIANTYENADLLLYHYGTYDAPEKLAFNADPSTVDGKLDRPERLHVLAPGEKFVLHKN